MFSNGVLIFFTLFLFFARTSLSQTTNVDSNLNSDNSDIFFLCKKDKAIRWLRAYKLESGKCKAIYSKEGYLQVISSATYFASCEGVLLSVKKNLEEGNFKCSQISKASVIELETE